MKGRIIEKIPRVVPVMSDDWPFYDPENLATFTLRQIMDKRQPILRVSHDHDGDWQFLGWETPKEEDAMLVCLSEVVIRDPSVKVLVDLPMGWRALRRTVEDEWARHPIPEDENEPGHDPP
jgi:hypothetical protein